MNTYKLATALIVVLIIVICIGSFQTVSGDDGGYPPPITYTVDPYPIVTSTPGDYPAPITATPWPTATRNPLFRPTPTGSVTATVTATFEGYPIPTYIDPGYPFPTGKAKKTDQGHPAPKMEPTYDWRDNFINNETLLDRIIRWIGDLFRKWSQ